MLKVLINEEEVLTNKDFTIKKEMLNTPSVILNNVYPKSWEDEKDYTSNFYHPQDYSKCKIIDESIVPADPGETITGTSFTIQDNDNTKLNELTELDGNTTQSGTPTPTSPQPINVVSGRQTINIYRKNLFNKNGNITLDYRLTTDGFDFADIGYYISPYINVEPNTTYTKNSPTEDWGHRVCFYSSDYPSSFISKSENNTITTPNNCRYLRFCGLQTELDTTMLEKGNQATTYEEFKGQSYEINLGKNLCDGIFRQGDRFTTGLTNSKRLFTTNNIEVKKDTTYTISTTLDIATFKYAINISRIPYPISTSQSSQQFYDSGWKTTGSFTFTPTENGYLGIVISKINNSDLTPNDISTYIWQLEKGSQPTSYTPYKTPIELCKIPNTTYKDTIFRSKGVNLFDKDNPNNESGYLKNDGTVQSAGSFTVSDYIDVSNYSRISISGNYGASELIAFYDKDKNFISTINMGTLHEYRAAIVPNNAKYLRVTVRNTQLNYYQVNEGTTILPYEPYNSKGKWLLHKEIGKVVLDGSENWGVHGSIASWFYVDNLISANTLNDSDNSMLSDYFIQKKYANVTSLNNGEFAYTSTGNKRLVIKDTDYTTTANFKTWLSTHNTSVYYILATPTTTEITDSELISQLNAIELLEGLNNVSVSSVYLPSPITIHYNYTEEQTIDDLLFCGVVKNSGNISLNPRQPHFQSLQILDFKTFLSEGELDSFVIYQKTILEAIQMVIANIQDYGFILGNINILNPTDVIGAYSTKNKTAYDVFNYLADITQSRWTTRLIDENHVAIDFYDPTLMVEGTPINYTQAFFENNLIDDMTYSYGSNNYRNKQVMTSSQVYSNISQQQSIVANGYQTQFPTEQPIGKINSITSNGIPLTFATFNEKEMGYVADFYYSPGDNYFESEDLRTTGEILIIDYVAIVEGRQIITNPLEIDRINDSTGRKGIISRYEQRNDATTSTELQKIGESYIKYKGTPEIKLKISTRKNIWEVGQRVQFNAPIEDLDTEYMVRTKKINYISTIDTIFYEYELISSFNSETEINYFDNQRAKASGNIGEGEYISRNIDIESTANIIFYDTETTEVQVEGDNVLNSILNSPFTS